MPDKEAWVFWWGTGGYREYPCRFVKVKNKFCNQKNAKTEIKPQNRLKPTEDIPVKFKQIKMKQGETETKKYKREDKSTQRLEQGICGLGD